MVLKIVDRYMLDEKPRKDGKVFRPSVKTRYLPGSVVDWISKPDLLMYNRMLYKCFYAQTVLDDKPPKMNPKHYVEKSKLRSDALRIEQIDADNKVLVKKINHINRMGGKVDTFNPFAYESHSRWEAHKKRMHAIHKHNLYFYNRLVTVQSKYPKAEYDKEWAKNVMKLQHMAKYTLQMFITKTLDQTIKDMPSITDLPGDFESIKKRPHCFIDFRIKDGISLGRIIIELYNDVVPKTCENFLSICKGFKSLHYRTCKVYSVVRGQYLETGDVTLNNGKGGYSIFGERFLEENHVLKHTKPGVVSMVPVDKIYNNSKFSITLDAQENLDKKRVVFGKVVKGMKTIYHIQDLGRKVGAPIVPIIIANCGELKQKRSNKSIKLKHK